MKMWVGLAGAFRTGKRKENRPENGNLRCKIIEFKAILYQCADRTIVVFVEIVVMVLRDSQEARDQGQYDYGLEKFHRRVTRSTFLRCG